MMRRLTLAPLLLLSSCSPHPSIPPQTPARQVSARAAPASSTRRPPPDLEPAPPVSRDLSKQVMGWVVVSDGAPLMRAVARIGRASASGEASDAAVKILLAQLVGLDAHATMALDLTRPSAIALLSPASVEGARPVLALLPVTGRAEVERAFALSKVPVRRLPWGLAVGEGAAAVYVAVRNGYAAVAPREDLVDAAAKLLAVPLAQKAEAPLTAHLDLANVYAAYGRELDGAVIHFLDGIADRDDPQLSFAMREARRIVHFADSMRALDLLVGSDDAGVTVKARAEGKPDGEWAARVAGQRAGEPAWGAKLLPRDAVLVYLTNRSSRAMLEELDASVAYLGDASVPQATSGLRASWRGALARATEEMSGEVAWAVWPGTDGGVGVGGGWRVRPGGSARRETLAAYERIGPHLAGVVARALQLDPKRFHLEVAVRSIGPTAPGPGGAPIPIDRVVVSVRWPQRSSVQRRAFEQLFGRELVLATAFVDDTALFAIGRDWKPRLLAMISAARGDVLPSLADDPGFRRVLAEGREGRVSLTWMPMADMARFIGHVAEEGHVLDKAQLAEIEPMLAAAGTGAIVSTTHAEGARWEVATRVPSSALPGMRRVGAALWKVALSPLLNPPAIPPLPIPPAQLTPKL